MKTLFLYTVSITICIAFANRDNLFAQAVSVQQPVQSQFEVGTTVSVPDRGEMHLGSVGSAAAGRNSPGFGNFGSGIGSSLSHSSTSVKVWIHDFEQMDRELLNRPASATPLPYETNSWLYSLRNPRSHWNSLNSRTQRLDEYRFHPENNIQPASTRVSPVSVHRAQFHDPQKAADYLAKSEDAANLGLLQLSASYARLARKYGAE